MGDTFVRSCERVWWLLLPCSLYGDEPMRCIRRTFSPRKRGFFYGWALSFAQRRRYAEHALHKANFDVMVYLSTPRGDGCSVGAAGLNNFRVTRLTHRSVFWLRRKRNLLEVEMMARKKQGGEATAPRPVAAPLVFPAAQPALTASDLSDLARCFWAKSGNADSWLSVVQHLMDAADVAGHLFDDYVSEHHRRLMASVWEGDQAKARAAFVFLAGIHDVGKVSPQFACQSAELAPFIRAQGLGVMRKTDYPERRFLPHGLVSGGNCSRRRRRCARRSLGGPRRNSPRAIPGCGCGQRRAPAIQDTRGVGAGRPSMGASSRGDSSVDGEAQRLSARSARNRAA